MADNPYDARVLKLTTELDALRNTPQTPMFTAEEIARREEKRRLEEELAVLGKLSGDKALTTVSQPILSRAILAGEPRHMEHGIYDPKQGQLRVFPEYQRRLDETRLTGELGRAEQAQASFAGRTEEAERQRVFRESEAEKSRLAREALQAQQQAFLAPYKDATANLQKETANLTALRARIKAQEEGRGKPIVGQPYKDMKKAGEDLDSLDLIEKKVTKDFAGDTSQGITWLGRTQDAISSAVPGFVPDQWLKNRDSWAILQRLQEMKARYALFGATLTGNEKSSWEAVTPPRGLNNKQLLDWFAEQKGLIHKAITNNAESLAQGGFNKEQLETFTRGLYKAPKKNKAMMWDPSRNTFVEVEE